ncbi:helix-turn-helix domain-containing protein [Paenibacillus sp. R14(2021)]|uniref:helix-turn-helix domain-containing protein n=1 Tax=Paenibacillus sp. R14(2021) TaxID=2859228 RepID=UPI001C613FD2|nr:helix-turn-helix domain-containing protein [Paenibacillus sp. R14(2021)]
MEIKVRTEWIELWQGTDDFATISHAHDNWMQVTLPVKGTCLFTQDEKNYELKQGSGLIQPPGARHHFELGKQTSVIILKVREQGAGGMDAMQPDYQAGSTHDIRYTFDADEVTGRFRNWMVALLQGQTAADPLAVQEVESEIVGYVGELTGSVKPASAGSVKPAILGISDPHMLRAMTYMQDCYANAIRVDELAGIALQSRYHFIRSFREATGTTPYQYLLKLRIEGAINQLLHSSATIAKISSDSGFASTSQFYRSFLKLKGMTPQEFRQQ